jgi:hypothetical protein
MRTLLSAASEGYPTFYNLILFMDENEQNIENWQI